MTNANGSTFVEVSIAMLLLAVMAGSVFSVAVGTGGQSSMGLRRMVADIAARQLADKLKGYVTGDRTDTGVVMVEGSGGLGFKGPGGGSELKTWSMDDEAAGIDDLSCEGCYALEPGGHAIAGLLPAWFSGPPYNATVKYVVTSAHDFGDSALPKVEIHVDWTEPQ